MKILAIETSCDETSAAVVASSADNSHVTLLSQVVASSMNLHAVTGGIIPEIAARNQIQCIIPVVNEALEKAHSISYSDSHITPTIDAIAVTYGPGLIGSLLVGVETVRTFAYIWDKPLIPVNHLFGHIYANWLSAKSEAQSGESNVLDSTPYAEFPEFPAIALIVSGGHTDLLLMKSHSDITWLGGTRDDAAGEAFDKIGRLLSLPYPAGPLIEQQAKVGNPKAFQFPRPLKYDNAYDFSFSGLKTAVLREVEGLKREGSNLPLQDLCRGVQDAITDVLVYKTLKAAKEYHVQSILLSGGVAANQTLRDSFHQEVINQKLSTKIFAPSKSLCTDNAAMIGAAAFFRNTKVKWQEITANPELYFD